jgi:RNA polymerase sigma factor (sigma-70 family)
MVLASLRKAPYMPKNDLAVALLLRRLKCGDTSAFDALYARYYFLVYSLALSYLHLSDDAKEITNGVFASFWAKRGAIDEEKCLRNYLCRATENACLNFLSEQARHPLANENEEPLSTDLSASDALSSEELEEAVSAVLHGDDLFVFLIRAEQNLPFKQIGSILGISENAASSLYTRACAKLSQDKTIQLFHSEGPKKGE